MGNSTTGIPDSTEKHLHRYFRNVLWNYDGVREITEQGVEMIRLIGSELYKLRKTFYKRFIIAYIIFYLAYIFHFWLFGRIFAELAFESANGLDFFISMPSYLEYAWIWLPILAIQFLTTNNTNCSYQTLIAYNRAQVFFSKVISYYLLCIPLLIIRALVFPMEWALLFKRGIGITLGESLQTVRYIRFFGVAVNEFSLPLPEIILKAIIYHVVSFSIMAAIIFACTVFSKNKIITAMLCVALTLVIYVIRQVICRYVAPNDLSAQSKKTGIVYYNYFTKNFYLMDWMKIGFICLLSMVILGVGFYLMYRIYSRKDMS